MKIFLWINILTLLLFFTAAVNAQTAALAGHWEGAISREGKNWRVWLDITAENSTADGTADFPDYGLYAMPVSAAVEENKATITVKDGGNTAAVFNGAINADEITGEWKGLNLTASFQLKRTKPVPLALYVEEEVSFRNGDATLAGTLVLPKQKGRHPAIVFTHGSGNQTRSETFYRSRAYLFARHGIAALIYDRRGKGASKGGSVTWDNLADDALAGIRFLKSRVEINPKQIGVGGFSQGGWVSPLAAARSGDAAFVLIGSAAAVTPDEQNDFNAENNLRAKNVAEEKIISVMRLRRRVSRFQQTGQGDKTALENEIAAFRNEAWFRHTLLPEKLEIFDAAITAYLKFDPQTVWEKVKVPVLAVWGEQDSVVPVQKSFQIIENALKKGKNKKYDLKLFPESGHGLSIISAGWDFPRLAPGYPELLIGWTLRTVSKLN